MDNIARRALVLLFILRRAYSLFVAFNCFLPLSKGKQWTSGFNFGPSQFQNLLYLAGYDPTYPPFAEPCSNETNCVLSYLGRTRDGLSSSFILPLWSCARSAYERTATFLLIFLFHVQSIRLSSSQMELALPFRQSYCYRSVSGRTMGCAGMRELNPSNVDKRRPFDKRPNILIFFTILSVGVSFAWLGVQHPSQWPVAVILYIIGCKSCAPVLPPHVYLCPSDVIPGRYHPKVLSSPAANPSPGVVSRSGVPRSQAWSAISQRFKLLQMKWNMDQTRV